MRIVRSLGSVDSTMRKSLYDSVIRHIMELAEFPKSAGITYDDELFNIMQPGSEYGEKSEVTVGSTRRISVGVEELRNEHDRTARYTSGHLEDYIYAEPRYGVYISPIMAAYDTTFTLSFKSPHKSELVKLANYVNYRQDKGNVMIMTGGEYFYYIPKELFNVIIDVHSTAFKNDTELPEVDSYLLDNLAEWVTITTDQTGKQQQFTARMQISGIHLVFELGEVKPNKNETYYELELRITFTHERPTEVQIDFPLYVTGTALPEHYHPSVDSPWIVERTGYKNKLIESADNIVDDLFIHPWLYTGEFIGGVAANVMQLFVSDVSPLRADEEHTLVGIEELPFGLSEPALAYLKAQQAIDPHLYKSVLRVSYYVSGKRVDPKDVWCDEELYFHSNIPFEVFKRHQISLELLTLFDLTDKTPLDSMRECPLFFKEYIEAVYPWILDPTVQRPSLPGNVDDKLNDIYWEGIWEKPYVPTIVLDTFAEATRKVQEYSSGMKTVHNGTILVRQGE